MEVPCPADGLGNDSGMEAHPGQQLLYLVVAVAALDQANGKPPDPRLLPANCVATQVGPDELFMASLHRFGQTLQLAVAELR